jgi:hypothetical protein
MSDASRVRLLYSAEATFAENVPTPWTSPKTLRFNSENLRATTSTVVSAELRSDRSRSDLLLVGKAGAGDINCELSFGTYDDLIEAAFCGSWTANVLKNGTTLKSFLLERGHLDIDEYFQFQGACVGGFHLDISAQAIVRATFNMMFAKHPDPTAATAATTPVAAGSTTPISSGPTVSGIEANTNMTGIKCTRLSFDLINNLRARPDVESIYSAQFGMGVQDVTGQVVFYFENSDLYKKFTANTSQALAFTLHDPDDTEDTYAFNMPKVKFSDFEVVTPGVDQDIIATASYRALFDSVTGYHAQITRNVHV